MNPDYVQTSDVGGASLARPLTAAVLSRLADIDAAGLSDVYFCNSQPGEDPAATGVYTYFLTDYDPLE